MAACWSSGMPGPSSVTRSPTPFTVAFTLAKVVAKTETVTFQATNAGQFGVVYGGLMEFELTLRGTEWLSELRTLGLKDDSTAGSALGVPLTLRVGAATHAGTAQLVLPAN